MAAKCAPFKQPMLRHSCVFQGKQQPSVKEQAFLWLLPLLDVMSHSAMQAQEFSAGDLTKHQTHHKLETQRIIHVTLLFERVPQDTRLQLCNLWKLCLP
jgi:hypothetical protein